MFGLLLYVNMWCNIMHGYVSLALFSSWKCSHYIPITVLFIHTHFVILGLLPASKSSGNVMGSHAEVINYLLHHSKWHDFKKILFHIAMCVCVCARV